MPKIVARFEKMADASDALRKLKSQGISHSYLDAIDDMSSEFAAEFNIAGTESGPSLSGLVLRSGGNASRIDKGPLLAADPMVSGMDPHEETGRNHCTRLIANAPDDRLEDAKTLIAEMGGNVESR